MHAVRLGPEYQCSYLPACTGAAGERLGHRAMHDPSPAWSSEEQAMFTMGVFLLDKNFQAIAELLPGKQVGAPPAGRGAAAVASC